MIWPEERRALRSDWPPLRRGQAGRLGSLGFKPVTQVLIEVALGGVESAPALGDALRTRRGFEG